MKEAPPQRWHWQQPGTAWRGCGIYHITLVQSDRSVPLLGRLTECADPAAAEVERTELGNAVVEQFLALPVRFPEVKLLVFCLMPDHFHGVIYVTGEMLSGVLTLVRGFWQGCKRQGRAYSSHAASSALPDPVFRQMPFVVPLVGRGQLQAMINYVRDNPRRAAIRRLHPDYYRIRRTTIARALCFSSMGNHFLLDWPLKQWVEVSRFAGREQIEIREQTVLQRASQGFVTYTAAVSEGEKRIARKVRQAGFPLVILMVDGFPAADSEHARYYKPGGVYFDACGAGRLLLLEPTVETLLSPNIQTATQTLIRSKAEAKHHTYTPLPTDTRRYRFMACNVIGRLLTAD